MRLRLEAHAAHYPGGGGHDLEWHDLEWLDIEAQSPTRFNAAGEPILPGVALPAGFEFHSGSVTAGVQRWHFCRKAPLSQGRCARCL